MAKISTYQIDSTPHVDDIVIGTDRRDSSITKNYRLGDILDLFQAQSYDLQAVTDLGNTTTNPMYTPGVIVDYVDFNFNPEYSVAPGRIIFNSAEGTWDFGLGYDNVVGQAFLEMFYHIKNQSGSKINDGKVIMFDGALGASGKLKGKVADITASDFPRALMGVSTMDIENGEDGFVTQFGVVRGIDTSQWSEGDVLFFDPSVPGGMTAVMPEAPNPKVVIAAVINSHQQQGSIFVRPSYGLRLTEIHDVKNFDPSVIADGSIIRFNKGDNWWEVTSLSEVFTHNSLGGLNEGNYIHMTSNQAAHLVSLTSVSPGYLPIKTADLYGNSPIFLSSGTLNIGNEVSRTPMTIHGNTWFKGDVLDSFGNSGAYGQFLMSLGAGNGVKYESVSSANNITVNGIPVGTTTVLSLSLSSGKGAYVDYVLMSTDDVPYRVGTVYMVWHSTDITLMDYSSSNLDIGDDFFVFEAFNNGVSALLRAAVTAGAYNLKMSIRNI